MNWMEVEKLLGSGGLGIRSLVEMNRTLHAKWLWRYLKEEGRMWKRIVEAIWGVWNGRGCSGGMGGPYGTGL